MKRLACVLSACLLAASAFALDLGAGVNGGSLSSTMSTKMDTSNLDIDKKDVTKYGDINFGLVLSTDYVQFGAGYLKLSNGGSSSSGTQTVTVGSFKTYTDLTGSSAATKASYTYIPVQVLLRYPAKMGKITLIPMGGLEYDFCVAATGSDGKAITSTTDASGATTDLSYFNRLFAKVGLGFEIPVTKKIVLRPQALCSFGLYSKAESDYKTHNDTSDTSYSFFDFDIAGGLVLAYRL